MKFLNNVDINKNQAISLGLEISSSHPASPVVGQVYFNTSDNLVYVYDGTSWNSVAGGLKTARIVIGTSTAGWTSSDCDYLCDGTADDVEINAAITALPATGGEIVILDGTYDITATINVTKDNVSIRGNGNATILKRMFDNNSTEGVITLIGRSGCKIVNLQIEGHETIYSTNYSIYLENSSNNTVTGNTCDSSYYGINLVSSNDNRVTGNTCNSNSVGINLETSSNNNIVTSNTYNNSECGIFLYFSSHNTITSNIFNNNDYGIFLEVSSRNTITGNTCIRGTGLPTDYTTSQHTILIDGAGNNYNLISNNNCMGKAPVISGGTGNTAYGNKWDAGHDILSANIDYTDTNSNLGDTTNVQDALDNAGTQLAAHLNSIGLLNYTEENYITDGEPLALSVNNLDMAIGSNVGSRIYTEQNYVTSGESVTASIDALDISLRPWWSYLYGREIPFTWAEIKDKCLIGDFSGILIGDWKPLTLTTSETVIMEVAGIDTYYGYASNGKHNIDFISRDCLSATYSINPTNTNIGGWLASALYTAMNGTGGIYDSLPAEVKAVIGPKLMLLENKAAADSTTWAWHTENKLWLPSELEVFGYQSWSEIGWGSGNFKQYPIFAGSERHIIKGAGNGGPASAWWELSPRRASTANFCYVHGSGIANGSGASVASRIPLCFRVS